MKIMFRILCLFCGVLGYAQSGVAVEEKLIKVTYVKRSALSPTGNFETHLYANDVHSDFILKQKEGKYINEKGFHLTLPYFDYVNKYTYQTKIVEENRTLKDKTVLYATWSNDMEWEITDEEKMIGEYKVRKAMTKSIDGEEDSDFYEGRAIAWFTMEIPIPSGPGRYYGLPGLILELRYERGRAGYEFKKLEFVPVEEYRFVELNRDHLVKEKEDVIYFGHKNSKDVRAIQKRARKSKQ